jgi:lipoyl(octanoyl) transferase
LTRWLQLGGQVPYAEAHRLQERIVAARAAGRLPDAVLLLEHAPVITLGRAAGSASSVLNAGDWPVLQVERGGDATWHGPGQLVAYPIKLLEGPWCDLRRVLRALEEAVVGTLRPLGLQGARDPRNTGVWLACPDGQQRKVASVGIACRRWVTWHGLALNVDPDPAAFLRIRPCGMDVGVMTRLADHGVTCSAAALAPALAGQLSAALDLGEVRLEPYSSLDEAQAALFEGRASLDSPSGPA